MNSGAASPRSRRALRPVHWRSQIVIAGKRCEISKASRQRSSATRFLACQRSIGENTNGLTDRTNMRHRQDDGAGPRLFFFLIGLALLMVWLTQQIYL